MMRKIYIAATVLGLTTILVLTGCGGGGGGSSTSSAITSTTWAGTVTFNNSLGSSAFTITAPTGATSLAYVYTGPAGSNGAGAGIGNTVTVTNGAFTQSVLDSTGGTAQISGTISGSTITGSVSDTGSSSSLGTFPAFSGTFTATEQ